MGCGGACRCSQLLCHLVEHLVVFVCRLGKLHARVNFFSAHQLGLRFSVAGFTGQHLPQFVMRFGAVGLFFDHFAQHGFRLRQLA